jgi:hypothetical protein
MKWFNFKNDNRQILEDQAELYEDILKMKRTPGWKYLEKLYKEQLEAYRTDNATNAKDWNDYIDKKGKIYGINLLLTDIEDIERTGQVAQEELLKFKD